MKIHRWGVRSGRRREGEASVCRLPVCRLNFTLRHLDVTCEAYDHFRSWLRRLEGLADGRLRFAVERVEASFPQLLVYERIQQLVGAGCHCRARRHGPRAPTRGHHTPVLPGQRGGYTKDGGGVSPS